MSLTTFNREKLEELKDTESRQYFYEEHLENGLPVQTRELRKKRGFTQEQLAELMKCDQSNISDWENPNYEYAPKIGTLRRLANIFDVPLIVRFGSWQELLEWDDGLSPDKIAPESFDEFVERVANESQPNANLTLAVDNPSQSRQTLRFQKDQMHLVASQEVSVDENNQFTGDSQMTAVLLEAAGSAR